MRRSHWPMRAGLTLLITVAIAGIAVPAEAASWGDAAASTKTVSFIADWKATNKIVITRSGRTITIDDRVEIRPGKGCKRVKKDKTRVKCTTKKTPTKVFVELRDRNDSVVNKSDLRLIANGGSGNDVLTGGPKADELEGDDSGYRSGSGKDKIYGKGGNDWIDAGDRADYVSAGDGNDLIVGDCDCEPGPYLAGGDTIYGGNGNDHVTGMDGADKIYGGNGDDVLTGQGGKDRIDGGAGNDYLQGDNVQAKATADVLLGGSGRDRVDYSAYAKGVVDLDGAAGDDGLPGEKDTVGADVEDLFGTDANDRLTGNNAANEINGWDGNDVITGGGGNDDLNGWLGTNTVSGQAGNDTLWTVGGRLDGGDGSDTCYSRTPGTVVVCEVDQVW